MQDSEREDLNISPSRGHTSNDVKKLEGEQVKESLAKKDQNELGLNAGATPEDGSVRSLSLSLSLVHFSRLAFFSFFQVGGVLLVKNKASIIQLS